MEEGKQEGRGKVYLDILSKKYSLSLLQLQHRISLQYRSYLNYSDSVYMSNSLAKERKSLLVLMLVTLVRC